MEEDILIFRELVGFILAWYLIGLTCSLIHVFIYQKEKLRDILTMSCFGPILILVGILFGLIYIWMEKVPESFKSKLYNVSKILDTEIGRDDKDEKSNK